MIGKGSIVRITVPGKYYGQTGKISVIDGRRMRGKLKRGYRIFVREGDWPWLTPRYFTPQEVEEKQP